jgi:hypothetical protein
MSDIAAIASTLVAMGQSRVQEEIGVSILKMNARAEQAVADMLLQNARQIQALSSKSEGMIDLYV